MVPLKTDEDGAAMVCSLVQRSEAYLHGPRESVRLKRLAGRPAQAGDAFPENGDVNADDGRTAGGSAHRTVVVVARDRRYSCRRSNHRSFQR